jgi:aquaporin Z
MREALRVHWPEYLMEAWGLGTFMISAGAFVTLIEYPGSPVQQAIADPDIRRALIGLAMGLTAIGIIYSPWGQRSGAHINPSVTLTFLRLGKVAPWELHFTSSPSSSEGPWGCWAWPWYWIARLPAHWWPMSPRCPGQRAFGWPLSRSS